MMPAANQGVGMNTGFPDVCTTPAAPSPIPVPYPNMGMNAMSVPFVPNIMVSMAPCHNMGTKPTLTNGDNAGVAHPLFMQPGGTTMGNPRIMMGGMPAAHLAVPTYGNNFNNPVGAKLVPSVTNVLLGFRQECQSRFSSVDAERLLTESGSSARHRGGILSIRIPCISLRCDQWLRTVLTRHAKSTLRGILVDLRANPGGSVAVAHRLVLQLQQLDLPIAIATDAKTASAAELLAASLQDRALARVFGTPSYGKTHAARFLHSVHGLHRVNASVEPMKRPNNQVLAPNGVQPDEVTAAGDALQQAYRWLSQRSVHVPK